MAITQPIFKLGLPDFAWQQIQIIPTDDDDDDNDYDDNEKLKWLQIIQFLSQDLQILHGSRYR